MQTSHKPRTPQVMTVSEVDTSIPETPAPSPKSASTFKPKEPERGGLVQVGTDTWIPWSGGKPTADWSGLENTNPAVQPNWYRPTTVSGLTKTQYYRTEGLEVKFTRDSDLISFQWQVMDKLEKYGMDTITYLPNRPG